MYGRNRSLFVAIFGCLFVALVNGDCKDAYDCLSTDDVNKLPSNSNLSSYCPAAAALAYQTDVCLRQCNFTATNAITNFLTGFQSTCSEAPGCRNIDKFYTKFLECFDSHGGLQSLIDAIVSAFNSKQRTDSLCRSLAEGRNCQKSSVSGCSYLGDLIGTSYRLHTLLTTVQHICGSENVPDILQSGSCDRRNEMIARIQKECNIACSIASTSDPNTICLFLQDQVNCILRNSEGCTEIERRFLLPRLNTYAIVNTHLQCPSPIQVRGINVQPTGLSPDYPKALHCDYVSQINACFNLHLLPLNRIVDILMKLLNGNFLTGYFCDLKAKGELFWDKLTKACADSFLPCRVAVAENNGHPSTYDGAYNISLGPFPLDVYGLNMILTSLKCPNPASPTLCPTVASKFLPSTLDSQPLHQTPVYTKVATRLIKLSTPAIDPRSKKNNQTTGPAKGPPGNRPPQNAPQQKPTPFNRVRN